SRLPTLLISEDSALVDARILAATTVAALAVGLMFAVTPLAGQRGPTPGSLRQGARGSIGDRRTHLVRTGIVGVQVALSVSLLIGAGLLARSIVRLHARSFGFSTDHVITAQLQLPRDRYPDAARIGLFLDTLTTTLAALPGVEHAAAINTLPLTGF